MSDALQSVVKVTLKSMTKGGGVKKSSKKRYVIVERPLTLPSKNRVGNFFPISLLKKLPNCSKRVVHTKMSKIGLHAYEKLWRDVLKKITFFSYHILSLILNDGNLYYRPLQSPGTGGGTK